ncbi:hypothetical protein RAD15_05230 [Bradyrhizobium sp. 14AA]
MEKKIALVTGVSKENGAEIAARILARGAAVAFHYSARKLATDQVVAAIMVKGGRAVVVHGNLTGCAFTRVPKLRV